MKQLGRGRAAGRSRIPPNQVHRAAILVALAALLFPAEPPNASAPPPRVAEATPPSLSTGGDATQLAAKRKRRSSRKRSRSKRTKAAMGPARVALVLDVGNGEVLYERNSGRTVPIASLTKLMTVMTFLDLDPDLDQRVRIERGDLAGMGRTQLRSRETVRVEDLLYHSLMSSDNAATMALVRVSGLGRDEFLARMNRKAQVLGLHTTRFTEFTGLDEGNVSSAADLAELLRFSLGYPLIARITSEKEHGYRSNRANHYLVNTNRLVRFSDLDIRGGKTGYIARSGYCLATWIHHQERDLIAVVLGAPSNPARFAEAKRILGQALSGSGTASGVGAGSATGS